MKNATFPRLSRGFTLVEMMVGVLIGLIGTVVIFQVFAVSEGQKRTSTGGSDAQQNGVFGLFQMERDLRMAGYGLNHLALIGSATNGWYEPTGQPVTFRLVPVEITNGVGGAPDRVRVVYGNSDLFAAPSQVRNDINPVTTPYLLDNRFAFLAGDLVVIAQSGRPSTLAQVGNLNPADLFVPHDSGSYVNADGATVPTQYNRAGGLPAPNNTTYTKWVPATSTGARLYNLGSAPVVVTYAIQAGQLVAINELTPGAADATFTLSDGIVQLQAQYGYDGNQDNNIASTAAVVANVNLASATDQWADNMPAGATATNWSRVIAVRLVVTARSMTPEKPDPATGVCNTTTVQPRWVAPAPGASPPGIALDVTTAFADANEWMCYRYRTFEVVVPLRNMVWFPQ